MSSEYAREFTIPDGFADILKDFTRKVLRAMPRRRFSDGTGGMLENISAPFFMIMNILWAW